MGKFLESEKRNQTAFKINSGYFSEAACKDGIYKKLSRPFCLSRDYAQENLFFEIRDAAIRYFAENKIKWHDGQGGYPSNHLCDSQVSCVNFLYPFTDKPVPLADLLSPLFPTLQKMLPIENDQYVAFEWIGRDNYLKERIGRNRTRTRGANFTSADAAVLFQEIDDCIHMIMIEWKYTESYGSTNLQYAKSGTDRTKIYEWLYNLNDCPIDKNPIMSFDALFYEPFYQLMRQQFLANEMERAKELGARKVTILHLVPAHNTDFSKVTSPALQPLGTTVIGIWEELIDSCDRFLHFDTEKLFGNFDVLKYPELKNWKNYISSRYSWINEQVR